MIGYVTIGAKDSDVSGKFYDAVLLDLDNTLYAYDNLQATSVPEPGVMVSLIGAGTVGGMFVIRRRRRQA